MTAWYNVDATAATGVQILPSLKDTGFLLAIKPPVILLLQLQANGRKTKISKWMNSQDAGRVACFRDRFETFQSWVPSYRKEAEPYLNTPSSGGEWCFLTPGPNPYAIHCFLICLQLRRFRAYQDARSRTPAVTHGQMQLLVSTRSR